MRDLNYLKRAANSAPFLLITTPFFLSGAEAQRPRASRGYSSKTFSETNLKDAFAALKVCTKELGEQEGLLVETAVYQNEDFMLNEFKREGSTCLVYARNRETASC